MVIDRNTAFNFVKRFKCVIIGHKKVDKQLIFLRNRSQKPIQSMLSKIISNITLIRCLLISKCISSSVIRQNSRNTDMIKKKKDVIV